MSKLPNWMHSRLQWGWMHGCTMDSIKCKTKICEDFTLNTDALCKASLFKCTTDGMKCVLRVTCFQALDQTGCVTDSNGNQCEWVPATNVGTQPYCTLKTCLTTPTSNTSESQCTSYFTNCTTENGGGCVNKSYCSATNVQAACTTALDGIKCEWDTSVTKMYAEIKIAKIMKDKLMLNAKQQIHLVLELMGIVQELIHVLIQQLQLPVYKEVMDHVFGLQELSIMMKQLEHVTNIHHTRVYLGTQTINVN